MLRPCVVSAPGKVILHGEHAVVYGKNAIASSLDLRTIAYISPAADDSSIIIELPDINVTRKWKCEEIATALHLPLGNPLCPSSATYKQLTVLQNLAGVQPENIDTEGLTVLTFLFLYAAIIGTSDGQLPGIHLQLTSNLPCGAGLGSSAAYSVCLSAGLLTASGLIEPVEGDINPDLLLHSENARVYQWNLNGLNLINKWAFEAERLIHGTPSGIDNAVGTFGGTISFTKGSINRLERMPQLRVLITNTKVPKNTKAMVAGVRERYNNLPSVFEHVMNAIEAISTESQSCLNTLSHTDPQDIQTEEIYSRLGALIDLNQQLLDVIGVNHVAIDNVCRITSKYGLHSKLTGAGGGGCVLTLLKRDTSATVMANLQAELMHAGYECWETVVGSYGVLYYTSNVHTTTGNISGT